MLHQLSRAIALLALAISVGALPWSLETSTNSLSSAATPLFLATNSTDLSPAESLPQCDDIHSCRTLYDIVQSCVLTIFACVWVGIHRNIPPPKPTSPKPDAPIPSKAVRAAQHLWIFGRGQSVFVIVVAVLLPEMILAMALVQSIHASGLRNELEEARVGAMENWEKAHLNNGQMMDGLTKETDALSRAYMVARLKEKWTRAHAFLIIMGGYQFYDQDGPRYALDPKAVIQLVRAGQIAAPTAEEVADRSKGDMLSKGLAVIQTLWFVTQCIGRRFERLPLTNLEVITLAYTVITVAMYIAWWEKPLNVACAIRVSVLSDGTLRTQSPSPLKSNSSEPPLPTILSISWWLSRVAASTAKPNSHVAAPTVKPDSQVWAPPSSRPPPPPAPTFSSIGWTWLSRAIGSHVEHKDGKWGHERKLGDIIMEWTQAFIDGTQDDLVKLELLEGVPTFWAARATKEVVLLAHTASMLVAVSFAAVHYTAWSYVFPSPLEQQLWRWSTVAMTGVPVALLAGLLLARMSPTGSAKGTRWSLGWWGGMCSMCVLAIGGPVYICARAMLFLLSFITLRSLPIAVYRIVEWTEFIPHI